MIRGALVLVVVLLAGCATQPEEPPSVAPTATTMVATTPAATPTQDADPFVAVRLVLASTNDSIRAGEPVVFRLMLENHQATTLWTNPTFSCSGTWDLQLLDARGQRIRIDDRDAMGCPSGGPLTQEVPPGGDALAEYAWDGWARPQLGQKEAPPPGRYQIVASARWGTGTDAEANESASAATPLTIG